MEQITAERGTAPAYIRMDNGPELTAHALRDWCRFAGTGTSHIDPGAPWENPFVESFGSRLRDELLAVEQFDTRLEAQVVIEDWRIEYNTRRPHSSLGWLAPATYAGRWEADQLAGLS
ncbi:MAG: transposase family protein [Chloroflexi bacterium]|nr:transposase family protein [Chloroflexota bacterium]